MHAHTIAMSGATGFVGTHLVKTFQERTWSVIPLGRREFDRGAAELARRMQGADVIVNLAGAPIIKRWTTEYKKEMYESRIRITEKIVQACRLMRPRPHLLISSSAVGIYNTERTHTEERHVLANDFLGRLCQDWEREALQARPLAIRTVIFRFGIVLSKDGGALAKMLMPFRAGLGGTIGTGSQPVSWIHIKDLVRAFQTVIEEPAYKGIYNLTAPGPTTNKGLTAALSKALHRPALLQVPRFALRLQYGEGAQILTSGQTVLPKRLLEAGFTFLFSEIDKAVKDCLS